MARLPYPAPKGSKYGSVNVMNLLSHSSATVDHWAGIGDAQFKNLLLSRKHRELVILLSTAKFHSSYEWTHHIPVSKKAGVTDAQCDHLALAGKQKGYFLAQDEQGNAGKFTDDEMTLLTFVEAIIESPTVSDTLWEKVRRVFSDREIVEIITLQGFYYTCSRVTTVLDIDMDSWAIKPKL